MLEGGGGRDSELGVYKRYVHHDDCLPHWTPVLSYTEPRARATCEALYYYATSHTVVPCAAVSTIFNIYGTTTAVSLTAHISLAERLQGPSLYLSGIVRAFLLIVIIISSVMAKSPCASLYMWHDVWPVPNVLAFFPGTPVFWVLFFESWG